MLDVHSDADHHRSVFTLAGPPRGLGEALVRGAAEAVERVDVMAGAGSVGDALRGGRPEGSGRERRDGQGSEHGEWLPDLHEGERPGEHPHVGAVDVAPIVYLEEAERGAACAVALVVADRIGNELGVPVFLYGELGGGRTRAQLRAGGVAGIGRRIAAGELRPDFGPARLHARAGATLVAARAPLVAFNLRLAAPATVADARRIAALIREGGAEGLTGVRAIGVRLEGLEGGVGQVSLNVERPGETPLAGVVERVRRHAKIADAEVVGLVPEVAMVGFPEDVPLVGFDPRRHVIERVLGGARRVDSGTR